MQDNSSVLASEACKNNFNVAVLGDLNYILRKETIANRRIFSFVLYSPGDFECACYDDIGKSPVPASDREVT